MKKLFKTVTLLALLLSVPLATKADTVTSLVVQLKNGSTQTFELATKPQVTFDASNLMIQSEETSATIALAALWQT